MVHGKNDLPIYYHTYTLENDFRSSFIGISQSKNTHINLNMKPSSVHGKNIVLVNIYNNYIDHAVMYKCIWPFA